MRSFRRHQRFVHVLLVGVLALSVAPAAAEEKIGRVSTPLSIVRESLWASPSIPACWENPATTDATQRGWVQQAVARTWEAASQVRFTGWGQCSAKSAGLRIRIADEAKNPHVVSLGSTLNGVTNGMSLNFTFANWSNKICSPQVQFCIEAIAVHEFGHVLGFAHEQNRSDRVVECTAPHQGTDPNYNVTPFDMASIMNYCNPNWNGNGTLSELDRLGVSLLYGRSGNPPIAGNAPSMVEYVTGSNRQFESLFVTSTGALGLTWKLNNSAWKGPVNLSEPNFLPQGGIISTIAYPLGNQLEAFYAANDGAIYVSFKANNGAWSEPQQLTAPGTTRAGAYLASAFYPTNNQLEVMFFDAQGRLNVLWKAQNGRWNGPVAISGPIAPAGGGIGVKHYPVNNQLEAMFIANNGAVHIAWKANNGAWQGPVGISAPGLAPAGSGLALSYHPLGKQLEGHFVDNRGVVNVIWKVNNGNWYPPMGITPAGFGVPGRPIVTSNYSLNQQLEGATVGPDGRINLFWKARNGPWKTVGLTGPNAASPGAPLDIEFSTPNNQLEIMFADPAGNMTLLFKAQNRAWSQAIRF